jgi:uncharacterized protein (DUF433 family)
MAESVTYRNSVARAAFIAGVGEQDINRLIDEELLPLGFSENTNAACKLDIFACILGAFYFHQSAVLTEDARKRVMEELAQRIKQAITQRGGESIDVTDVDWTVSVDAFTKVNVKSLAVEAAERATALSRAEAMVISDEEIMSGEPVFRGTRVPVWTIAGCIKSGETKEATLRSFPTITAEMVDAATLWVTAHPHYEPRKSFGELNPHLKLVSSKSFKLDSLKIPD